MPNIISHIVNLNSIFYVALSFDSKLCTTGAVWAVLNVPFIKVMSTVDNLMEKFLLKALKVRFSENLIWYFENDGPVFFPGRGINLPKCLLMLVT